MLNRLKADIDGILELVQKCPPALQETALKVILEHWFMGNAAVPAKTQVGSSPGTVATAVPQDLPGPVKNFMTANGLTFEEMSKVYSPIGAGAQLLISGIPGAGKAMKQANLALLLAVKQALETGAFSCTLKQLREMATHYDCYDAANFSTNLKSHKNDFKPRAKGADLELSGPGLKRAGQLIEGAGEHD